MTDLPYTYTEPNGDSLRMFSDGPDLVVTVRQDGGARTVVVPREETPNLARAVLAAAGDTGHEVLSVEEIGQIIEDSTAIGARSMQERAAACAEDDPTADYDIRRQIRALPLLPDDDTTPVYESDVESRLSALESLASDQADALEAQSQLIDTLRTKSQEAKAAGIPTRPYNAWTDG